MQTNNKTTGTGFSRLARKLVVLVSVVILLGFVFAYAPAGLPARVRVSAAENTTVNFQMRLLQSSGAIVADGFYHAEFKLYNASTSSGSSQGSCSGDSNCVWVENYTGAADGDRVRVANGYLSVSLGTDTPFGSINWDEGLWLGVNIGGSGGTASWDGEMTPRMKLTAVPYAFRAKELRATSGANSSILQFATPSGTNTITIPAATGSVCLTTGNCAGIGGTGDILNNGQNGTVRIGSNDGNSMILESNNVDRLTITSAGNATLSGGTTGVALTISNSTSTGNILTLNDNATPVFTVADGGAVTLSGSGSSLIFSGVTTDITTGTDEALTISPNGQGDTIVVIDNDTNLQVTGTIIDTGSAQSIAVTLGDDGTNDTVSGLNVTATTANTGDADILIGVNIADLASPQSVTERALQIGSDWDANLFFNDTTSQIQIANTGTFTFEDDAGQDLLTIADGGTVGNVGVTGTLVVSGLTTLNGGLTVETGDTFTFNGSAFDNFLGTGLTIGSGDLQTTLGTSIDLASEVGATILPVANGGTNAATSQAAINNLSQLTTNGDLLYHNGTNSTRLARGSDTQCLLSNATTLVWGSCGGGSGDSIQVAGSPVIDANFINTTATGTITGTTFTLDTGPTPDTIALTIGNASDTVAGAVTTGTQTFGGAKTFNTLLTGTAGATISGATTSINASSNFATNINTGTSTGAVSIGNSAAGAIAIQSASTIGLTGTTSITGLTGTGTALTVSNSTSTGNILTLNDNATLVASIADGGAALFKNSVNSLNAFQVQNSSGTNLLNINTATTGNNLLRNPSFENGNINGWSNKGSGTVSLTTSGTPPYGLAALQLVTNTAVDNGAKYLYSFKASTTYSLSLWMRRDTSTTSTINVGHDDDAGTDTNCLTGQTVNTTWTNYTCTFTTDGTIEQPDSHIYIKQTDTATDTIYIDGVTLVESGTALAYSVNTTGSLLQVDNIGAGNITLLGNNSGETGPWQIESDTLPTNLMNFGSVTANGYIYVVGGYTGSAADDEVYYAKINADGSTGAWTTSTNKLPAVRQELGSVVVNGYIYAIGGENTAGTAQSTVYYAKLNADGSMGTWQTGTALTTARSKSGYVAYNGYIYILGGAIASTNVQRSKQLPNGNVTSWTETTELPVGTESMGTVAANGYVYLLGGNNTGASAGVYYARFNADGTLGTWQTNTANPLPDQRAMATAAVSNGYIYVIGGHDDTTVFTTVFYARINADGSIGAWSTSSQAMPVGLACHRSVAASGYVYALAGDVSTCFGAPQNDIYYTRLGGVVSVGGNLDLVGSQGQNLGDSSSSWTGSLGGSITAGNGTFVGALQVQGQATFNQGVGVVGDLSVLGTSGFNGSLLAGNSATTTTGNTEATARTNVTTVTIDAAGSFANGDVIFVNNSSGQDYYTRITAGGGTTTLTVSPAVSYLANTDITKYNIQNVGALATGTTFSDTNRFFQGYFLGGVVVGAGTTTYGDQSITSTGNLRIGISDTTATLLVVDTKTDAEGGLAGENGAIYYNSNTSKFRCYQASAWTDCIGAGGSGANTALSNLAAVAINTALLPGADNTIDLGSSSFSFRTTYSDTSVLTPLVDVAAAGTLSLGTGTATGVTIGGTTNTTAIALQGAAAATYTIGNTGTTGTITVGQSTATNTISIGSANGTASTQTISIGGGTSTTSGGKIINIGGGIPGAGTSNSILIGTAGFTSGTVDVSIGSNAGANHTTLIQGGNGTTAGAEAIRINSNSTNGSIALRSGTSSGAINLNASQNSPTNINTGTSTGAVSIGNSAAGAIAIQSASTIGLTGTTSITGLTGTGTALTVSNSTSTGNIVNFNDNATTVFSLADGGAATFKNQANSNSAFAIQNAAGTSLLNVDTSNQRITVAAHTEFDYGLNSPYGGFGIISNLMDDSEDFTSGAFGWTRTNITDTANTTVAPNGETTADTLTSTAAGGFLYNETAYATANTMTFSVWIKSSSGSQPFDLRIDAPSGTPATGTAASFTANTTWRRYHVTQTVTGTPTGYRPTIIITNNASTIIAWGAQFIPGTVPGAYSKDGESFFNPSDVGLSVAGRLNVRDCIFFGNGDANANDRLCEGGWHSKASGNLEISATQLILSDDSGNDGIIIDANSATDITTSGSQALNISAGGTGDIVFGTDADTNFQLTPSAASGVDLFSISATAGSGITTDNVDGIFLQIEGANGTSTDVSGLHIDFDPITGSSDDTFTGILLDDITGTAAVERAITIGTGWDASIYSSGNITLAGTATGVSATLLGLPVKTDAGDPTTSQINGGMYYNSNTSKFRCYQASAWTDCIGSGGSGTSVAVDGVSTTSVDIQSVAAGGTVTGTVWTLTPGLPDTLTLAISSASATVAGAVTTAAQTFAGDKTFNGSVVLGDASGDNITFTGRVNSSILPSTNDTYDLGSDALRFRDLFLGGETLHIGTSTSDEGAISYNTTSNTLGLQSTGNIELGTSDTTGTLLVIDTKTGAGDPTGVNGGLYYNSNAGKFRCYQASTWTDCVGSGSGGVTSVGAIDGNGSNANGATISGTTIYMQTASATVVGLVNTNGQTFAGDKTFNGTITVANITPAANLTIGTSNTTGTLLVLDTKTDAGDPTGVNGGMYYNSDAKNFRCRHNGHWQDCDFASLRAEWLLQDDFTTNTITTGTGADLGNIGDANWTFVSIGTGGTLGKVNVGTDASNQDRFGVLQMNSPATVTTGTHLRLDNTGMAGVPSNMVVEFAIGPINAAAAAGLQQVIRAGLHDSVNSSAPTDGMYFQYSTTTAAGNWFRCTQTTCVDTGVARTLTANVYQRFRIQTNSAGTAVEFFINETSVGSVSTNLPGATASYGPSINHSTVDATIRQWKIDYFQIKRNLTTLR